MRGRQIIGPRRVAILVPYSQDANGERLEKDVAIDLHKTNVREYWDSLFDESKLVLLDGEKPSWFTITPLTSAQKQAAPPTLYDRSAWYLRCGLTKIENYPILRDGVEQAAPQPDRKDRGSLGLMASEEWYNSVEFTESDALALYRMIYHISEAQYPLAKCSSKPAGASISSETATVSQK